MFVTRKRYDADSKNIQYGYNELKRKYWELLDKYELILDYLGVVENKIPSRVELVGKK